MLRQVIEMRVRQGLDVDREMRFKQAIREISYINEDGQRVFPPLTQKQYEEFMKHADEVAKKWL